MLECGYADENNNKTGGPSAIGRQNAAAGHFSANEYFSTWAPSTDRLGRRRDFHFLVSRWRICGT
jgi:hypothetical protein